jgi:imidazole glycerol-phosphate synthase subunit HisH
MKNIAIVNYGMGNLDSVVRAIEECGGKPYITRSAADLEESTHIILPGVGAFPDAIKALKENHYIKALNKQVIQNKIPFLGLCLGMQLIAEKSYEVQESEGLKWIKGEVKCLIPKLKNEKTLHIGWNEVTYSNSSPLFNNIPSGKDFYFVHSYYFDCEDKKNILATTSYCGNFPSVIGKNNIYGAQFHPEKSQKVGFQFLKNFLQL